MIIWEYFSAIPEDIRTDDEKAIFDLLDKWKSDSDTGLDAGCTSKYSTYSDCINAMKEAKYIASICIKSPSYHRRLKPAIDKKSDVGASGAGGEHTFK